ncbi:MAG: putative peptidoglycan glycosyltransferase FtsW [Bacillota bacterium]|nr:putative peptidoglycan glycosyltransferase FtsW [Bacillota bacterium]
MIVITILLSLFGLVMVFSASYYTGLSKFGDATYYLRSDIVWVAAGWVAFVILSFVDYHMLKHLAIPAIIVGFILLGLIFTPLGITINNATRWLDFKLFTVMPGEVIKACFILFFAWYYSYKCNLKKYKFKGALVGLAIAGAAFLLILKQPNFSTAGIVLMLAVGIMFIAGLSWWWIIICGGGLVGTFIVVLMFKGGYIAERLDKFWDPFSDALGKGYQVSQGLLAFGSGGVTGLGLGKSVEKALYLPEPMNDFILPIIGEELGFIGVMVLVIAFVILIWRLFTVAMHSDDRFGMLIASGVALHMALQVILNIAVVTASFPPTGVVLPLISLGGTSTILVMGELGIAYNISKQTKVTK